MGRLFGIALILATLWLGVRLWTHGLAGLYAPAEPAPEDTAESDDDEEQAAAPQPRQARPRAARVPITEYVRDRVSRDIQRGAERRGR